MDLRLPHPPADETNLVVDIYMVMLDQATPGLSNEGEIIGAATPGQRAVYSLMATDGEVNNGGFAQFFTNATGALIALAIGGANLIGASTHEEVLRGAASIFPDGSVPEAHEERNEVFDSLPDTLSEDKLAELDERWYRLADELDEHLRAYIAEYPGEFFRAGYARSA